MQILYTLRKIAQSTFEIHSHIVKIFEGSMLWVLTIIIPTLNGNFMSEKFLRNYKRL